ncbi:MAG: hypothetical protein ACOCQG_03450 [Candidatus Nanoarchaeia archaeon]
MGNCENFPCIGILEDLVKEHSKKNKQKNTMPEHERVFFELNSYIKTYMNSCEIAVKSFYYKGIEKNIEDINNYLDK